MKESARQRLAMLKRGEILPIPNRTIVICPDPTCRKAMPWNLKRCQKCKTKLPPRPPKRCRLCGGEVRGRRRSWCGDECQNAYYIATNNHYLREKIKERDRGVCAECGLDTAKLRRRVNGFKVGEPERQAALQVIKDQGFNVYPYPWRRCPSLWHADHIVALDEAGAYELSNVQTLCHPCHKIKTAEHATRKGKQRRLMGQKAVDTNRRLAILQGLDRKELCTPGGQ